MNLRRIAFTAGVLAVGAIGFVVGKATSPRYIEGSSVLDEIDYDSYDEGIVVKLLDITFLVPHDQADWLKQLGQDTIITYRTGPRKRLGSFYVGEILSIRPDR